MKLSKNKLLKIRNTRHQTKKKYRRKKRKHNHKRPRRSFRKNRFNLAKNTVKRHYKQRGGGIFDGLKFEECDSNGTYDTFLNDNSGAFQGRLHQFKQIMINRGDIDNNKFLQKDSVSKLTSKFKITGDILTSGWLMAYSFINQKLVEEEGKEGKEGKEEGADRGEGVNIEEI